MNLTQKEIQTLRELAKQYMEIACLPVHKEKIKLWKALNRGDMQRPMVVIDQIPWHELNAGGELTCVCRDPFWKSIESQWRMDLYKWKHFAVDMVLDPFIMIPKVISDMGYGIQISENILKTDENNSVVSHSYKNQIQTEEDIEKIKDMVIQYDEAASMERLNEAEFIFEGIAPVQLNGGMGLHLGLWDHLSFWMGLEAIFYDFVDRPEFIHKVLRRITDATIAGIKQINDQNIHDNFANTCHCSYIFTDELHPDTGVCNNFKTSGGWGFSMAQLMTSTSPECTKEFEVPYINQLAEHYGMIYYGCCERLDDRLDIVKQIKNVKKISCSPWSNKRNFAEQIGSKIIMSNKPNPAFLGNSSFDEEIVRKDLLETCRIAKENHVNVELILKDISTVKYDPKRLDRWAQIAMEVVSDFE